MNRSDFLLLVRCKKASSLYSCLDAKMLVALLSKTSLSPSSLLCPRDMKSLLPFWRVFEMSQKDAELEEERRGDEGGVACFLPSAWLHSQKRREEEEDYDENAEMKARDRSVGRFDIRFPSNSNTNSFRKNVKEIIQHYFDISCSFSLGRLVFRQTAQPSSHVFFSPPFVSKIPLGDRKRKRENHPSSLFSHLSKQRVQMIWDGRRRRGNWRDGVVMCTLMGSKGQGCHSMKPILYLLLNNIQEVRDAWNWVMCQWFSSSFYISCFIACLVC